MSAVATSTVTNAAGTTGTAGGHDGTVFDIGYQRYTGAREGRGRARRAIYKDGVRAALGFGRGGKAKVLPWFFITVLGLIGLIMAIVSGAANKLAGPGAAEKAGLPTHTDYYHITSLILLVFAAVVGPELLCPDRRNGTLNLYRVRPLTGTDYILPRWGAFLTVMLVACWLPQCVLFLGLSAGDPDPVQYLRDHWLDVPRFLLSGAALATFSVTLALLVSSFTSRRAYASVFMVGFFIITTPFTFGISEEVGGLAGQWISMFTVPNIPLHVNDFIFGGVPGELTEDAPSRKFSPDVLIAWWFAWTAIPLAALWARYRRLSS